MDRANCHTCIYACWDMGQAMQSFNSGFPSRPMCANHPDAPGRMQPTPLGGVCRNYRPRPPTPEGDVKRIPLTSGTYAYVDAADYEWLSQYRWHQEGSGYACRRENGKRVYMHRQIMQPPEGMVVDHIEGNKVNNCRFNLRVCTPAENQRNRTKRTGAGSRFRGVCYRKDLDKYSSRFRHNGERMWLGFFDDEVEAARAYDHKAVEYRGLFACVNLPEEWPPERRQQVYAKHQARLEEEGKSRPAGKGRVKEGKRPRRKKTTRRAQTRGRRKPRARRKTKPARRTQRR